jgi:hypothetical protein
MQSMRGRVRIGPHAPVRQKAVGDHRFAQHRERIGVEASIADGGVSRSRWIWKAEAGGVERGAGHNSRKSRR